MHYLFVYEISQCQNESDYAKLLSLSDKIIMTRLDGYSLFIHRDKQTPTIYKTNDSHDYVIGKLYCCVDETKFNELMAFFANNEFEKKMVDIYFRDTNEMFNAYTYQKTNIDDYLSCDLHDYRDYLKNNKKYSYNV